MFNAMLDKTATSELWWIGLALTLFLTALLILGAFEFFRRRRTRSLHGQTQEDEQKVKSESHIL